jgi:pSer/pThr/pTyr-binding forkhead associated (FHA) protein
MSIRLNVVMEIPGKEPRTFEYEFEKPRIQLGRDEHNDIQVPLSTVSRSHAVIYQEGNEWFIEDLKSTHGCKHNGKPLGQGGKKLLRDGDVIEIVHFKIHFHTAETFSEEYSAEHTEALARKMVEEVLASIGVEEMPYLRVMNGPDEGRKYELTPDRTEVVIGRGVDCDFQINDANISRHHGRVKRDWTDITIEDMGSKNGVLINDRKISRPSSLKDADEILLGAVRLTFIDPSAKYLGKLNDIPAFADATRGEEVAPSNEDEPVVEPEAPPAPAPAPVEASLPEPDAPVASDERELPPITGDEPAEGTSMTGTGQVRMKKKLGAFEYGLIGLAAFVVVGLLIGVILILAG